jgi:hypothetical protein
VKGGKLKVSVAMDGGGIRLDIDVRGENVQALATSLQRPLKRKSCRHPATATGSNDGASYTPQVVVDIAGLREMILKGCGQDLSDSEATELLDAHTHAGLVEHYRKQGGQVKHTVQCKHCGQAEAAHADEATAATRLFSAAVGASVSPFAGATQASAPPTFRKLITGMNPEPGGRDHELFLDPDGDCQLYLGVWHRGLLLVENDSADYVCNMHAGEPSSSGDSDDSDAADDSGPPIQLLNEYYQAQGPAVAEACSRESSIWASGFHRPPAMHFQAGDRRRAMAMRVWDGGIVLEPTSCWRKHKGACQAGHPLGACTCFQKESGEVVPFDRRKLLMEWARANCDPSLHPSLLSRDDRN